MEVGRLVPFDDIYTALGWPWGETELAIGERRRRNRFPTSARDIEYELRQFTDSACTLDVGAQYSPGKAAVVGHGLVFDFDATDNAAARRACGCSGAKTYCAECVLETVQDAFECARRVQRDFYPTATVYVFFSGSKGAHVYVVSEETRKLCDYERVALVTYVRDVLGLFPDSSVTTDMKHLAKFPYSPHPTTRRMAVCLQRPFTDAQELGNVPRLSELASVSRAELLTRYPLLPISTNDAE